VARADGKRLSLRVRLTLIYVVLFVSGGAAVLSVTYILVQRQVPPYVVFTLRPAPPRGVDGGTAAGSPPNIQALLQHAHETLITSLVQRWVLALLVVTAVTVVLSWLISGRALRPLRLVTDAARQISQATAADRHLHRRIALRGPHDEVRELADTFDTMLARLDESFDGQRRFVANASHELRTPLTLNRALIEVAMRRSDASADLLRLGATLLSVNERHERLIEGLLLLARSQSQMLERVPADLAVITAQVLAQTRSEASATGVTLTAETEPAVTLGDPVLLERLVYNLVHNGVRHNLPAEGWVHVRVGPGPGERVTVTVANSGAEIAPESVPALFDAFRRGDAERVDSGRGAGLGLSIVQSVAGASGGQVSAAARTGGGLTVRVELPAAAVAETAHRSAVP
jgi:signal transduction histidine kinase